MTTLTGFAKNFAMMAVARFGVGVQGIAIADRAYQKAVQYARDRVQSRPVDGSVAGAAPITSMLAQQRPGVSGHTFVGGNAFMQRILGVTPLAPGFAEIEVAPQRCGLTRAEGAVCTPRGPVPVLRLVSPARDRIVMPGFVDTHRHTWQTPVRGVSSSWL